MSNLHAWRNAAHELPPEGVPVWMMDGDGTVSIFETFRDDDGAVCWSTCDYSPWWTGLALNPSWHSVSAHYEGDRVASYWHPLPDVPTLAELDAAHGAGGPLPCPFCGGGRILGDGEGDDNWFECMACNARGPRTTYIDAADVDASEEAWNRRAAHGVGPAADAASEGG